MSQNVPNLQYERSQYVLGGPLWLLSPTISHNRKMKTPLKGRKVDLIPHTRLTVVRRSTATECILCVMETLLDSVYNTVCAVVWYRVICVCMCVCVCVCVCVCLSVCVCLFVCLCVFVCLCLLVCLCVCDCVCVCVCVNLRMCTYVWHVCGCGCTSQNDLTLTFNLIQTSRNLRLD